MKDIIEIWVDGQEELMGAVANIQEEHSSLVRDRELNNFYCTCGESRAVWLEDQEMIIVVVDCRTCKEREESMLGL
jgi:hypothetical protein